MKKEVTKAVKKTIEDARKNNKQSSVAELFGGAIVVVHFKG